MPETTTRIDELEKEILEKKKELAELRRAQPREDVKDYTFQTANGDVKLSDLFDGRPDLLIIHNMGQACRYCMLWADGFNGVLPHLENRTAVVMVNPDPSNNNKSLRRIGVGITRSCAMRLANSARRWECTAKRKDRSGRVRQVSHAAPMDRSNESQARPSVKAMTSARRGTFSTSSPMAGTSGSLSIGMCEILDSGFWILDS